MELVLWYYTSLFLQPNSMGIDPSDEKCVPFYEKMKKLDMVSLRQLLIHETKLFKSFLLPFSLSPPSLPLLSFSFLSPCSSNRLYLFTQVMNTQWMQPSLTTVWEIPSSSESETSCDIMHRPTLVLPDNEHSDIS